PRELSRSTRMQTTTVQMLAAGIPLLGDRAPGAAVAAIDRLRRHLAEADAAGRLASLGALIEAETAVYRAGDAVLYEADDHAITGLTDTTERAPTFNLTPFENVHDTPLVPSPCFLVGPTAVAADDAWHALWRRSPRPLAWPGFEIAGAGRLRGFDFSAAARDARLQRLPGKRQATFKISREGDVLALGLGDTGL